MKLNIKSTIKTEVDMLFQSLVSENISHHLHMLDLKKSKKLQNKENVKVNGKKLIKINNVIIIKKKGLYKIVVPMSL